MRNIVAVLMLTALSLPALAAGDHAGGHARHGGHGDRRQEGGHDGDHHTDSHGHGGGHGGHQQMGDHGDHGGGGQMEGHDHGGGHDMHGAAGAALPAGIGRPGNPNDVSRTIEVTMDDSMRFAPDRIRVEAGETVRFFLRNTGDLPHEFVIGTRKALAGHAAQMRDQPRMRHDEPSMAALGSGKLGGIVWQFDQTGTVDFACLVPGHYEAGMVGTIAVE